MNVWPRRGTLSLVVTVAASVWGCADNVAPASSITVTARDSSGVSIVEISGDLAQLPEWTLASQPSLVISGDAPPYLSRIGEVDFTRDGHLIVEDDQSDMLRVFDGADPVGRVLGGQGEGPGEFLNVTELTTSGDTAFAYDRRLYRLTLLPLNGDPVRTIQLTRVDSYGDLALDAWALGHDRYVLHRLGPSVYDPEGPMPQRDPRSAILLAIDGDGAVVHGPVEFDGGYSARSDVGDAPAPFSNRPIVQSAGDEIVYGSGLQFEFVWAGPDLQPRRVVRWAGWDEELAEEEVARIQDITYQDLTPMREQRPEIAEGFLESQFAPHMLPERRPAVARSMIASNGEWWVARFQPPQLQWDEEAIWHVLSPEYQPLARVRLPKRSKLAAVSATHVAVVSIDDLEVQHLNVFEIVKSSSGAS